MKRDPIIYRGDDDPVVVRRFHVLQMYGITSGRCVYCGKKFKVAAMTCDHIIPLDRGGQETEDNYAISCKPCNKDKCNRTVDEYRRWLGVSSFPLLELLVNARTLLQRVRPQGCGLAAGVDESGLDPTGGGR